MRFALHHASRHKLEHIIYIIPYTSIIEQNAGAIRAVLEEEGDEFSWVMEHHSNLDPETQSWHSKLVTENWDAPIIFTTMVQFLESLFGGGTRGARHMHNLANSVIIFDEIQNLPVNCVHLFCNAISFLTEHCRTTSVLCTATQPLLNDLRYPEKGQLEIPENNELAGDVTSLFDKLKRVEIKNRVRGQGWSETEICELICCQYREKGNCLVIVNTKKWAQKLYVRCMDGIDKDSFFHLSTSLYPAHRKEILDTICQRLKDTQPVLCISTQLIEAGVDVDFNSVVRFLAGLDSIAQAVIVPHGRGKEIIGELCAAFEPAKAYELMKQAQKFSVNVFPNIWQQLKKVEAVRPIQEGEEIYYLDAQYYSDDFGLSIDVVTPLDVTII